jgi:hypothetical protein
MAESGRDTIAPTSCENDDCIRPVSASTDSAAIYLDVDGDLRLHPRFNCLLQHVGTSVACLQGNAFRRIQGIEAKRRLCSYLLQRQLRALFALSDITDLAVLFSYLAVYSAAILRAFLMLTTSRRSEYFLDRVFSMLVQGGLC